MTKLMNLDSRTLVTRIADNLREQIIMGQLESGARIRQDEFAVAFGVSRTPLREAFRLLEAEGWIRTRPRSGVHVGLFTSAEVQDILVMRLLLEPLAIRVAATHHTEADAEKLRNLYDKWRTSQTRDVHGDEYDTANQEFHFGLYGLDPTAEMKPFHALLHRHWERYTRYRRVYYWRTADFSQISGNHHLRLLEAWATRDADRAEKLLAHHVLSAGCTLVHSLTAEGPAEYSPQLREVADRYGCELEDPAPHATGDSVGRQSADDRVEPFSGRFG